MTNSGADPIDDWTNDIHQGDAAETLREMPESSVHTVVTSPPYFGLRDYGAEGQIGLEESLDDYIDNLLEVAEELRRVLRDDGSWWLNLGDSFAGSGRGQWDDDAGAPKESVSPDSGQLPERETNIRRKSKMLVPHRVAIALEDAGWVVRSDAVWAKPNPMPHPVKDRLNEHKEFLFHLAPEPDYWFDLNAIREPHKEASIERRERYDFNTSGTDADAYPGDESGEYIGTEPEDALHPNGKNPGDILDVAVKPFPDAHFAVYPPELVETPIQASCPPKVCAECGTPHERATQETPLWERELEDISRPQAREALQKFRESDLDVEHVEAASAVGFGDGDHGAASQGSMGRVTDENQRLAAEAKGVLGGYFREFCGAPDRELAEWSQACDCETDATKAGIVLDPFAGAGTTCLVGKRLGRRFIGVDLNPEYVALAQKRVGVSVDEPERLVEDGQQVLSALPDGGNSRSGDTGVEQSGDIDG